LEGIGGTRRKAKENESKRRKAKERKGKRGNAKESEGKQQEMKASGNRIGKKLERIGTEMELDAQSSMENRKKREIMNGANRRTS
jgi:hypothetical protein